MMRFPAWFCLFLLKSTVPYINGSTISFQATPNVIKDGLTSEVKLRCEIKDTAASTGIIGRRDVTQTGDNVASVTSIVLMKDGHDVASVSTNRPAHVLDGSTNTGVAGGVAGGMTGGEGGEGFLQVTITDPSFNHSGEFSCQANAVRESGHVVTFSKALEVTVVPPTIADLVMYVRDLKKENEVLKQQNEELQTKVFFSAGMSHSLNVVSAPQVLVYDKVFSNVGGTYDANTGLFTCQISGYYKFSISATNIYGKRFYIHLQLNNRNIMEVHARNGGYDGDSNSVIVKIAKGDVVRAFADKDTHIEGGTNLMYNTFNGELMMQA